jgi:hypothetical protein
VQGQIEVGQDGLVQSVLEQVQFRMLNETTPGSEFDRETNSVFDSASPREAYKALDLANTQIWDRSSPLFRFEFLSIPRLSTLAIAHVINQLVKEMPPDQAYLNIGLWCGFSFISGIIGNDRSICIGVDNFSDPAKTESAFTAHFGRFKTPGSQYFKMDYREYFEKVHRGPIGVYFYDGDHSYDHQLRGLELAEPFLAKGSYIMVDDTNDPAPRQATLDFLRRHGGRYQLVLDKRTPNNGHPTYWNGLMICKRIA